ncbi:DUF1120 domain-containing protein [Enterobacter soli]|uniref:DUF1120 domain-containing protein n=1 Tax=Enterobacter soli TaxID=885040 RepID=UPI003ED9F935
MKKILLATALSLCVSSAFAAETAVLKVTGTLTNSACTPELSNGGVVDYGKINLGSLSSTAVNQLGHKNIDLTINCTAATKVSWNMIDDRADSRAGISVADGDAVGGSLTSGSQIYGLGLTAGSAKIGNYSMFVNVDSVTADGNSVDPIYVQTGAGGTNWVKSTNGLTQGENYRDFTVATTGTTDPLAFQTATFPLTTSLAIQDTTTLAITDDTKLDGQLTISLRYL